MRGGCLQRRDAREWDRNFLLQRNKKNTAESPGEAVVFFSFLYAAGQAAVR